LLNFSDKGQLGKAAVKVTQLGFGGAPLGDLYAKLPESEAIYSPAAISTNGRSPQCASASSGATVSSRSSGCILAHSRCRQQS